MFEQELQEKRSYSRHLIQTRVQFQIDGFKEVHYGELDNLSKMGFLLWTDHPVSVNMKITIYIEPEPPEQVSIKIIGRIVRAQSIKHNNFFGYGCMIEEVIDDSTPLFSDGNSESSVFTQLRY